MAKATKRTKSKKAATNTKPLTISIHGSKIDLDARLDLDGDESDNDLLHLFAKIGESFGKTQPANHNPLEDIEMHDDFISFVVEESKRCPDQLLDQVILVLQTERASRPVPTKDAETSTEEPTPSVS